MKLISRVPVGLCLFLFGFNTCQGWVILTRILMHNVLGTEFS